MTEPISAADLVVAPDGISSGHCACCGHVSRCAWGYVDRGEATVAAYWVRWTLDHIMETGASIEMVLGAWGDATSADDRTCVSLIYRCPGNGPWGFMVVDAHDAGPVQSGIAGTGLRRDEVIGTALATQVFAVIDAIVLQDRRLFSSAAEGREEEC